MKKMLVRLLALVCLVGSAVSGGVHAQTGPVGQVAFAGLRSAGMAGQINAIGTDSAGNLYLVLDAKDGVRIVKTDSGASQVLAQTLVGAAGDVGLALTVDPSGQVLVAGTTTSTALQATAGAAIP